MGQSGEFQRWLLLWRRVNGHDKQWTKKGNAGKDGQMGHGRTLVLTTMVVVTGGALPSHPREQAMIVLKLLFLTVAMQAGK